MAVTEEHYVGVTTKPRSGAVLHPFVVFVNDEPNPRKNISMDVALVGTRAYKTLLEWIYRMDIDIARARIVDAYDVHGKQQKIWEDSSFKYVALGKSAAYALTEQMIPHFELPHVSTIDVDRSKVSQALTRCRAYVYKRV